MVFENFLNRLLFSAIIKQLFLSANDGDKIIINITKIY